MDQTTAAIEHVRMSCWRTDAEYSVSTACDGASSRKRTSLSIDTLCVEPHTQPFR